MFLSSLQCACPKRPPRHPTSQVAITRLVRPFSSIPLHLSYRCLIPIFPSKSQSSTTTYERCNFANCAAEWKSPENSRFILRRGSGTLILMSAGTVTRGGPSPTFTLFPNLPTELQTKIWRCNLPGPSIIQLCNTDGGFFFRGTRGNPALYTCRTSREVALSVFEPTLAHNKLPPMYIDLAYDTLHRRSREILFPARKVPNVETRHSIAGSALATLPNSPTEEHLACSLALRFIWTADDYSFWAHTRLR